MALLGIYSGDALEESLHHQPPAERPESTTSPRRHDYDVWCSAVKLFFFSLIWFYSRGSSVLLFKSLNPSKCHSLPCDPFCTGVRNHGSVGPDQPTGDWFAPWIQREGPRQASRQHKRHRWILECLYMLDATITKHNQSSKLKSTERLFARFDTRFAFSWKNLKRKTKKYIIDEFYAWFAFDCLNKNVWLTLYSPEGPPDNELDDLSLCSARERRVSMETVATEAWLRPARRIP